MTQELEEPKEPEEQGSDELVSESIYSCQGLLYYLSRDIETWRQGKGFETGWTNVPEKLMLIVTELSEAMEAYRKLSDEDLCVLANRRMTRMSGIRGGSLSDASEAAIFNFEEELADAAIRLLDLTASLDIDIEEAISEKMQINEGRPLRHGKER